MKFIYKLFCLIISCSMIFLTACGKNTKTKSYTGYHLYYIDASQSNIISRRFIPKSTDKEEILSEIFKKISSPPNDIDMKQVISEGIEVEDIVLDEDDNVTIYFNSRYNDTTGAAEVLRRAAIVKNITQIKGINSVQFYVAGQPLTDGDDNPIGFMKSSDFVDNSNGETGYLETTQVTLYYANKEGNKLVPIPIKMKYDASVPIEQMVIELLIKGPSNIKGMDKMDIIPTIPKGTIVNKITVKSNTCNIDFSKEFLYKKDNITNEVAIYSVVNTLTEMNNINKVQFSIDGEPKLLYNETVDFNVEFERNLDIVE